MIRRTALTVAAFALLAAPMAGTADAATTPLQPSASSAPALGAEPQGSVVQHWGFDGTKEWHSKLLDATQAQNNNAAAFAPTPAKATNAAPSAVTQGPWTCSTWARPTVTSGSGLSSSSHSVCSGDFLYHYTRGQFLRSSWSGPRDYTGWANGPTQYSPNEVDDVLWYIGCPGGGTYNYSLQVQSHLVDTNGDHGGPYEVGAYVRAACGT
ncbi:hypothetical protein [Kitasatospora purpeofusca]|uniref:Secreted protein n=1 Tax=Kitasatospora purpeofusca TaxID=67352 RepID=A0ABZ1TSB7_9ACTN|nr:hypothetical protein [Kitasatospora purpeofusca]